MKFSLSRILPKLYRYLLKKKNYYDENIYRLLSIDSNITETYKMIINIVIY
jgi:hypothetical protein